MPEVSRAVSERCGDFPCESDETRAWVERWLSPARFGPYLEAANGNVGKALELYHWNVRLCQTLMGNIGCFEVALRNAYDRTLCEAWNGNEHWLFDKLSPVRRAIMRTSKGGRMLDVNLPNRKAIGQSRDRAHDPNDPNQVISNLMLGFWSHLTDRSRERDLWIPALHRAWSKGTDRAVLHRHLYAINKVRNRVAHNERLFDPARDEYLPSVVDRDIIRLLQALCPEAGIVESWLRERPGVLAAQVTGSGTCSFAICESAAAADAVAREATEFGWRAWSTKTVGFAGGIC